MGMNADDSSARCDPKTAAVDAHRPDNIRAIAAIGLIEMRIIEAARVGRQQDGA